MKRVATVLGVFGGLVAYQAAYAGAVSCAQANSSISISVCNSPTLKALDTELDQVYEAARAKLADQNAITYSQRRWVNTVLGRCKTEQCLEHTYQKRIQVLKQWADAESSPDQAVGRYSMTRFNMVFRGDAYGWATLETQDCLNVQKGQADQYTVQLALTPKQSDQQCALGGTYVARGAYLERVPDGASPAGAACTLQIHPMKHSVQIKDPQGACQQWCGASLPLDGVEFLRDQTGINACHAPKRTAEPLPAQ